jgi:PAS domain S-box-containing protein
MFNRISKWANSFSLLDDDPLSLSRFFQYFSFLTLLVVLIIVIQYWMAGELMIVIFLAILFVLVAISLWLKGDKWKQLTIIFLLVGFTIVFFWGALISGKGLRDDTFWGIPVVLIVSGLMMTRLSYFFFTLFNMILAIAVFYTTRHGWILPEYTKDNSYQMLINGLMQIALIAYVTGFLGGKFRKNIYLIRNRSDELEASNYQLNSLITSSPLGIVVLDSENRVLLWNNSAGKMFAEEEQNVLGKQFAPFGAYIQHGFLNTLEQVRNTRRLRQYEMQGTQMDGRNITANVFISALQQKGADNNLMLIFEDITLRKIADLKLQDSERALKKQNEDYLAMNEILNESNLRILKINEELSVARLRAEESDRLKSAFLANISHEVRTPLNGIMGFSEILKGSSIEEERRRFYLDLVVKSGQQLVDIIDDVMSVSRIDAGEARPYLGPVKIRKMMESISNDYFKAATEKGLECTMDCEEELGELIINTDEEKLKQCLSNLLRNAIKFTYQGFIRFGVDRKDSFIEFFVEDSGIGIASEHQQLIFERFRQVEDGSRREFGGSGLGLTIAKSYIEMMGGTIHLQSTCGKGSRFAILHPGRAVDKPLIELVEEQDTKGNVFTGKKILIAEDQEMNYYFLQEIFFGLGIEIIHAWNGREAVEACRNNSNIDMVLMDIKMPVMDGLEATRQIKIINPTLPIIATTAYAMANDRENALRAGCDEYLSKPIRQAELFSKINRLLIRHKN